MTSLKELNGKVWYRFLKVIYILCYLPFFLLLYLVIYDVGRDYHGTILPDTVQEVLKDPEFYKLNDSDKNGILSIFDVREFVSDHNKGFNVEDLIKNIKNRPVPTIPLNKKYNYKSYYTWNILDCIKYGLILTIGYIFVMECIRRGFYYVVIGKIFPKE